MESFMRIKYTTDSISGKEVFDGIEEVNESDYDSLTFMQMRNEYEEEELKRSPKGGVSYFKSKNNTDDDFSNASEFSDSDDSSTPVIRKDSKLLYFQFSTHDDKWVKVKNGDSHKHYVNIKGNETTLKIVLHSQYMRDLDQITWEITSSINNSNRQEKKPYFKGIRIDDTLVGFVQAKATAITYIENNKTEIILQTGFAGGDAFTITAKNKYGHKISAISVNWRKIWLQITHIDTLKIPSIKYTKDALAEAFIELEETGNKTFNASDFSRDERIIYKRSNLMCNEDYFSCTEEEPDQFIVIANEDNLKSFDKFFEPKNDLHINAIVCDEQYNHMQYFQENNCEYPLLRNDQRDCKGCPMADVCDPYDTDDSVLVDSLEGFIELRNYVVENPLNGDDTILSDDGYENKWQVYDNKGKIVNSEYFVKNMMEHIEGPYCGTLKQDSIKISKNRADLKQATVDLPSHAQKFLMANEILENDLFVIKLNVQYNGISQPFLGAACDAPNALIRYDKNKKDEFVKTLTHEIGHMLDMVPEGVNEAINEKHKYLFYNSGPHCNNKVSNSDKYCVMMTESDDISQTFCDECLKHFKSYKIIKMVTK